MERRLDTLLQVAPADGDDYLLAFETAETKDPVRRAYWSSPLAYLHAAYHLIPVLLIVSQRLRAEGKAEGKAEGLAEAVARVLERRGITVSEEAGSRINGCTDTNTLDGWLDRALTATTAEDLFADE